MPDNNYTTKNFFTDGGDTLVLGGNVVFTEDAVVDDQRTSLPSGGGDSSAIKPVQEVADSTATTVVALKDDFNTLLARLRESGLLLPR